MSALALRLSERGLMVTQLHTIGTGQPWSFWGVGAVTHSGSSSDCVVTSDGQRHLI